MEYVKKQYSPTLAMIKEHLGFVPFNDYIREMIKDGSERMTMKHEQMLFLSAQMKADNYDQEQEEFEERAAIMEYDGGMDRDEAEKAALQLQDREDRP
jgi:adenosine deaminase